MVFSYFLASPHLRQRGLGGQPASFFSSVLHEPVGAEGPRLVIEFRLAEHPSLGEG